MQEGVDSLTHDKTRPPGTLPSPESVRQKVLGKTAGPGTFSSSNGSLKTSTRQGDRVGRQHPKVVMLATRRQAIVQVRQAHDVRSRWRSIASRLNRSNIHRRADS